MVCCEPLQGVPLELSDKGDGSVDWSIAVLGAGGIGGSIGAYLTREGHDVTLIDQWSEHVAAMRRDGLTLTDVNQEFTVPVKALQLSDVSAERPQFDVVFLSVKCYDTIWSTHFMEAYLKPWGCILPVMNGLNDMKVARIVGFHRTVGCVPTFSAGVYDPGHVVRTDPTTTHAITVGELSGVITPRVKELVAALQVIGPGTATTNIWGARWAKLVWNSMGNALAGLMGPAASDLTQDQRDLALSIRAVTGIEAARVGLRTGVAVEPIHSTPAQQFAEASTPDKILALKAKLAEALGDRRLTPEQARRLPEPGRPSLLQDVIKGRRTETDYLNGEVVVRGKKLGIPTPMNEAIVEVMHKLEAGELLLGVENLELLEPYVVV